MALLMILKIWRLLDCTVALVFFRFFRTSKVFNLHLIIVISVACIRTSCIPSNRQICWTFFHKLNITRNCNLCVKALLVFSQLIIKIFKSFYKLLSIEGYWHLFQTKFSVPILIRYTYYHASMSSRSTEDGSSFLKNWNSLCYWRAVQFIDLPHS